MASVALALVPVEAGNEIVAGLKPITVGVVLES